MSDERSILSDKTYQKAKELLGRKNCQDLNKLNTNTTAAGLSSNATKEQKKAFKRGQKYASDQK